MHICMPVDRLLPTTEAADVISLARDIADKVLTPIVDAHEKAESYPEGVFAQLGAAGLLSLPQPEEWGGGGQPFEVYLQVLEEIAARPDRTMLPHFAVDAVVAAPHGAYPHECYGRYGPDPDPCCGAGNLNGASKRKSLIYLRFIVHPIKVPATKPAANVVATVRMGCLWIR